MCGLELVRDRQTKEYFPAEAELGSRLTQGFAEQGIILRGGDTMNLMPPLCVNRGEIDEIVSVLDRVIGQTSRDLGID